MQSGNRCRSVLFCAVLALISPILWTSFVSAAEPADAEPVIETREVIVSATKTPLPISQVTSAVEVITGEDLERKKIKMVIDALRLSQGVFASSSGGPGTEASVRMRGAQSKHTMVLIDGVIVNSPTTGAFDFSSLTAENIERIEIIRGAQSMLYGSDAIGGVISIITKRGTGRPTASAFLEYGSFASIREGAQFSGSTGIFDYSGSLSRWDSSSFSAINYRRGASERDGFHNWQGSARLGVSLPHNGRLEFNARWWNSDVNFDDFAFSGDPTDHFGSKQTKRNLILSGSYEQPITSWWSQKLTLAQANERLLARNGPTGRNIVTGETVSPSPNCVTFTSDCFFPFNTDLETLNRRLEWQHNFQIGKPLLLSGGYQYRDEQGDATGFFGAAQPNRRISSHAGFAQAQVNLWDRLVATAGVRQDSYNVFGDATTYRLTGGYLIPETGTKIRASYGTGFKAPTLNDLFFQGFGNPDLKAEKSKSFDVGIDQSFLEGKLQLSAGYFSNRFDNLIAFLSVPSPICPAATFGFCPINIAAANSHGLETSFKYEVMKGLELRGQYTMTVTRAFEVPGRTDNTRLPRWPLDQFSAGISIQPIDPLRINLDYRFVGARNNDTANTPGQKQGSFGVVNASASYDVTQQWQIFGRVDNLFNQKYEEILNFGTPIRSVYGGVKFTY